MVLLIDTNIILDYLLKREPFYNNAKAVMEKCCLDDFHGYIALHTVTTLWYIMRRIPDDTRRLALKSLCEMLTVAGTTHEDRNNPAIHEENVRLSLECVNLAKQMGCQLYVDAGSQAEYGIVPGVITEDTPCNPVSAYGKAKLQMYRETSDLAKRIGLKYIHLRILSVYGENDHPNTLIISSLKKLKANEPIEMRSGGQKWNYVYVKDAARQVAELSIHAVNDETFHQEVYNIASNDTRKLQDFIIALKEITGSASEMTFGGYNPEKDVNLNPDTKKTVAIVKPLTSHVYEEVIKTMI